MKRFTLRTFALGAALAGLFLTFGLDPAAAKGKDDGQSGAVSSEARLRSRLAGAAIDGLVPSGHADFRWDSSRSRGRLNIEVEDVNLPTGTTLTVSWVRDMVKTSLGTITVSAAPVRGGELEFNTNDGQPVPSLKKGDMIVVEGQAGVLLAGAL